MAAAKKVDKAMTIEIDKSTNNDKRNILSDNLRSKFKGSFLWLHDFDDEFVFFEFCDDESCKSVRTTYEFNGTSSTFGDDLQEVVRTTDYKVIEESGLEKSVLKVLTKFFGGSKAKSKPDLDVIKQFGSDDEPMYAIEPLYTAPGEVDGHGDVADRETIEGLVVSLNKANEEGRLQSGLFHKHKTDTWKLEKAWVNPVECMIGDQLVPEGQPIAKTLFTNKEAFEMRINGEISGLSIGARAKEVIDLDKTTEELQKLQGSPTATRELKGIHFDWDYPELTYTSPSQGGAASLKNDAYIIDKAQKAKIEDLDEDQLSILKRLGEEFISLEKHLGVDKTITPSSEGLGENNNETGTKTMSDQTQVELLKQLAELKRDNNIMKAQKTIEGFGFDADLGEGIAGVLADLDKDNQAIITKALAQVKTSGEEALDKAVEKAKTEAKPEADTDLQKALDAEAGTGGEPEADVEKSFLDEIAAFQDAEAGATK